MSHATVLVALDGVEGETMSAIEAAIHYQMEPFDENQAGEWFGDGSRWDWYVIGGRWAGWIHETDMIRRKDIDPKVFEARMIAGLKKTYAASKEIIEKYGEDSGVLAMLTDVKPGQSEAEYIAQYDGRFFPVHSAFLRNRVWNEHERMGWFGMPAATECEVQGKETHICVFKDDAKGSQIVSWKGSESWDRMFWPRFVEPLPPETLLVTVDYHV